MQSLLMVALARSMGSGMVQVLEDGVGFLQGNWGFWTEIQPATEAKHGLRPKTKQRTCEHPRRL